MTVHLLSILWFSCLGIISVECLFRLPLEPWIIQLLQRARFTVHALFNPELNDEQREVALRQAAFKMVLQSSFGLGLLALISAFFWGVDQLSLRFGLGSSFSLITILEMSLSGLIYYRIRRARISLSPDRSLIEDELASRYSPIARALHSFALDENTIRSATLRWEERRYSREALSRPLDAPVWVCGLARAGTTMITELLYQTGAFTSLTYRDMPFVLAPRRWRTLSRTHSLSGGGLEIERAHKDGMMINLDSPEALEEVFWSTVAPEAYQDADHLSLHAPTAQQLEEFRRYLNCITLGMSTRPNQRYLSKNNNQIIRLAHLHGAFETAYFVIPIRSPVEQATSLLNQHLKWVKQHQVDPFSLDYMNWLCHFEFGLGHRPFHFASDHPQALFDDPTALGYWVERWRDVYAWLSQFEDEHFIWVDYQQLIKQPRETLRTLLSHLKLQVSPDVLTRLCAPIKNTAHPVETGLIPSELFDEVEEIYQTLVKRSIKGSPQDAP